MDGDERVQKQNYRVDTALTAKVSNGGGGGSTFWISMNDSIPFRLIDIVTYEIQWFLFLFFRSTK